MTDFAFHTQILYSSYKETSRQAELMMDDQEDKPSFITVIKEGINTQKMIIPPKFLKDLDEDFPSNAILIGPSGDQWQVTIFNKEDNIYMQNGWPQFLKYYSVVPDDFLRFTYDGENCFWVQLFAQNGCERLHFQKRKHFEAAMPSLKREKNGSASSSKLHELKPCQKEMPLSNKGSLPKDDKLTERSNACKLAQSFTSDKPWIKHLMTKSDVEPGLTLNIATEFARKYLPESVKEIILLESSEGKYWEVTSKSTHIKNRRYIRFSKGWQNFVRDNKLMRDDTCIFELTSRNHMKVHIFKCAPN